MTFYMLQGLPKYFQESVNLSFCQFCKMLVFLFTSAVAPDFSNSVLKAQTLARQGGDVLIECRPRMSPRGMISWRKGKEALRESHRYFYQLISLCLPRTCLLKWYRQSNMIQVRQRVVTDQSLDYSHQNVSTTPAAAFAFTWSRKTSFRSQNSINNTWTINQPLITESVVS